MAVIRPPLTLARDRLAYGLAAGVVQASGQVRFTFSHGEAGAVAEALRAARRPGTDAAKVIQREKYVYKVAGNKERRETPTPPGVCRHVAR